MENVLQVIHDQAVPTYDAQGNVISFYNIVRPEKSWVYLHGSPERVYRAARINNI